MKFNSTSSNSNQRRTLPTSLKAILLSLILLIAPGFNVFINLGHSRVKTKQTQISRQEANDQTGDMTSTPLPRELQQVGEISSI